MQLTSFSNEKTKTDEDPYKISYCTKKSGGNQKQEWSPITVTQNRGSGNMTVLLGLSTAMSNSLKTSCPREVLFAKGNISVAIQALRGLVLFCVHIVISRVLFSFIHPLV